MIAYLWICSLIGVYILGRCGNFRPEPKLKNRHMPAGDFITEPLTLEQLREGMDEDGYVEGIIEIGTGDLVERDCEGVLDLFSERLTGCDLLRDINYDLVGSAPDEALFFRVSGDVSEVLDFAKLFEGTRQVPIATIEPSDLKGLPPLISKDCHH